jgi:gluconokinase
MRPDSTKPLPTAIVVMGVCGSGKSVVGAGLAERLGYAFRDGDGFHPKANVEKMSAGTPLTDDDRWPWLDAIGAAMADDEGGRGLVVACSALKRVYRERIAARAGVPVVFVHLDGPRALLAERMKNRKGHFMPPSLLDSQLATLEKPAADEPAIVVSVEPPVDEVIGAAISGLATFRARAPRPPERLVGEA